MRFARQAAGPPVDVTAEGWVRWPLGTVGCIDHEQSTHHCTKKHHLQNQCRYTHRLSRRSCKDEACTAAAAQFDSIVRRTAVTAACVGSLALPAARCRSGEMGLNASTVGRCLARPNSIQAAFGSETVLWRLTIFDAIGPQFFPPNCPRCSMTVPSFYFLVAKISH